jgi:hypothetical protein
MFDNWKFVIPAGTCGDLDTICDGASADLVCMFGGYE